MELGEYISSLTPEERELHKDIIFESMDRHLRNINLKLHEAKKDKNYNPTKKLIDSLNYLNQYAKDSEKIISGVQDKVGSTLKLCIENNKGKNEVVKKLKLINKTQKETRNNLKITKAYLEIKKYNPVRH